ncbi:3-oxoacyl-[acyl-carrier-protein] synthase III C-terminal domain-containing protein [Streptomyces sp. A1499]|uniref:3-oxoacyl-[acyl-carrier-protein] synthase III C-terminal domain-containing protein n=1 Tax=Streptomyces sp. A1499 TaxID=2563104 RepID=UPI00109EAA1C|nr:3-oxoacyl-[acyl-carrier-protein] synthase III C-terminal domain-containing protein [Streptomyces sp. A1499]THC51880.1 3-oxoacyl-ACP synthase [Streptomyces sp. A1499]
MTTAAEGTGTADAGIGIGAIHCLLPDERVAVADLPELARLTDEELKFAEQAGIKSVGVFPDTEPTELAARACRELLAAHPGAPDLMLHIGSRAPDVLIGSDSGKIAHLAGLTGTFPFTVDGLGCAGSSAAWALGRDLLIGAPSRHSVLLTYGSRPTAADRVRRPVTVIGDGAFAMTLVRGGRPLLKAHRMETDSSFHDLFKVEYKNSPWSQWREVCDDNDRYSFELAMHSRTRLGKLVDQVLADAGIGKDDVAATLMQNVTSSAFDFYKATLGLPIHPVCATHLAELGHLGPMDVVLNLDRLLATGEVGRGQHVLVLSNSPVAAWTVTLWEV